MGSWTVKQHVKFSVIALGSFGTNMSEEKRGIRVRSASQNILDESRQLSTSSESVKKDQRPHSGSGRYGWPAREARPLPAAAR